MKIIVNESFPTPRGHYSTAIVSGGHLYMSGQLPISFDGIHHHESDFGHQFEVVFRNIKTILEECGSSLGRIVKVTAYISEIDLWTTFNELYAAFMVDHKPVRTVVPVPNLHYGYKLEVDIIAEI